MLSYLHGFHAGNFADVHKHWILSLLLGHLLRKPGAVTYIETHAGRGCYDLRSAEAEKTREYASGIARLCPAADTVLPTEQQSRQDGHPVPVKQCVGGDGWSTQEAESFALYLEAVRACNPDRQLCRYPGSPWLAQHSLRAQDRLILMEAHPAEHQALKRCLGADRRVAVHRRDGYEGLQAFVPAHTPRLLVLCDPSYEDKDEYRRAAEQMLGARLRARHGLFALWYPLLPAARHRSLLTALQASGQGPMLYSELCVRPAQGEGMHGSGMVVVNPPWRLDATLREYGPALAHRLAGAQGTFRCEWLLAEA